MGESSKLPNTGKVVEDQLNQVEIHPQITVRTVWSPNCERK